MKFTHLHVHSHYSLLDGLAKIDPLIQKAADLNMEALAITDHGAMYGAVEFYQKAKKAGIKPIIGSEVYVAPNGMRQKRPKIDGRRYHLVLLAKNEKGYQNLVKLTTKAWLDGFYYKPRVDKKLLRQHSEGIIACSACLAGEIPRKIQANKLGVAERHALEYQDIFGKGNYYLEIEHHPEIPEQKLTNQAIIKIGKKYKIPLVATHDVHYINPEDAEAQDILMAVNTDKKVADEGRLSMKNSNFSLQPQEQMVKWFSATPDAVDNTQKIVSQCKFEMELYKTQMPHFATPSNDADAFLKKLAEQGLTKRYGTNTEAIQEQKIHDRLNYELKVIGQTGFASYFLIVQDFVNWAKANNIVVGPGRGSAAGSLVSYLLNVTDIDPLKYNLMFERFLNVDRVEMPDIDLDFADTRRDEVIEYVRRKYGQDHVAQIITFGAMAARGSIRDVGRATNLPYNLCDQIAKAVPFGLKLNEAMEQSQELKDAYRTDSRVKKLIDTAKKLEGVARHASTHACGVVITKDPLNKIIPLQHATQGDTAIVTQYGMNSVTALGILKMDFLGLKNLTIIEDTINRVKVAHNEEIKLVNLPLADPKSMELFQKGQTTGIFQLESQGMKKYLKQLIPSKFEDIIAMVALYRPGPMEFIPDFIARKHGYKRIEYLHPKLESILSATYGIAVYQEQVLEIVRDLASFTLAEADVLRKAVGKKIKELLNEQHEKFIKGCAKNSIDGETAESVWHFIEPFARYGFNKAHSTCYAMIGYWTAYLKSHYPSEFMAALLTSEQNDIERIAFLIGECRDINIDILAPDVNESQADFTVVAGDKIRFGLNAVKNVGQNIVQAIVQERQQSGHFSGVENFIERVKSRDLNKKSLESLAKCGALDSLTMREEILENIEPLLNYAHEIQRAHYVGQTSLFGAMTNVASPQLRLAKAEPLPKRQKLLWEKELLGLYVSEHPLAQYAAVLKQRALPCRQLESKINGQRVRVAGLITKINKIMTKNNEPMLFVGLEDLTGRCETVVFPRTLAKTAHFWQLDKPVYVIGKLNYRNGSMSLICDEVEEIK